MRSRSVSIIIMGNRSDWETMQHAALTLRQIRRTLRIQNRLRPPHPEWMVEYAASAEERGLEVIMAGAGGLRICRAW